MSIADLPGMLVSEQTGWTDIARSHRTTHRWFLNLVMPMSLIPPVMYAYAEIAHPGAVFPLSVPDHTATELMATGAVFYLVELAMVSFMAMVIQNMAISRDHDPGFDNAYALAAIAPAPLWLSSLALFVPSLWFNVAIVGIAWLGAVALIRHGVRPLLKVIDEQKAHYIANMVTLAGVAAWIGLMVLSAGILSLLLIWWR